MTTFHKTFPKEIICENPSASGMKVKCIVHFLEIYTLQDAGG